jgi:hypothetical protein
VWPIHGFVKEGYETVATAFKKNFEAGWEVGAGFTVYCEYLLRPSGLVTPYSDQPSNSGW